MLPAIGIVNMIPGQASAAESLGEKENLAMSTLGLYQPPGVVSFEWLLRRVKQPFVGS
jgi:hypothetical protein